MDGELQKLQSLGPAGRLHRLSVSTTSSDPAGTSQLGSFHQSLAIPIQQPVTSMSISPTGRDAVLAARRGLYIVDLENPLEETSTRFIQHLTRWEVADVQWNPHPTREAWVASTSNQKALVWNLSLPGSDSNSSVEYILAGHQRAVSDLNWSPHHPETLATCSYDSYVHLWDLRGPVDNPTMSFPAWTAGATQVKFSRKSDVLLASSHDADLRIWDIRRGSAPVSLIRVGLSKIYGIDWSHTSETEIATCSQDCRVQFWDVHRKTCLGVIDTGSPVWRARYTPFGHGILTMPQRQDNALTLWSRETLQPIHRFTGHLDTPREFVWRRKCGGIGGVGMGDMEIRDDAEVQLVTWAKDQTLRLWTVDMDHMKAVGYQPFQRLSQLSNNARTEIQPSQPIRSSIETQLASPKPAPVPMIPAEDTPKSWEEEMKPLRKRFPNVTFDRVDFPGRSCTMTIQRACEMGGFIRVDIRFPVGYPGAIAATPLFEVQRTGIMSMANRTRISEALAEIANQSAKAGSPCLVACVEHLLDEDASVRITPATPSPVATVSRILTPADMLKPADQRPVNSNHSPPRLTSTAISWSNDHVHRGTSSLDAVSVSSLTTSSDNWNLPYPCLCGARFSPSGRLVAFHSPIPHPATTRFSFNPSNLVPTSPITALAGNAQPQTYAHYERYRAFLLEAAHGAVYATGALASMASARATPKAVVADGTEDDDVVRRGSLDNKGPYSPTLYNSQSIQASTMPTTANLLTRLSIARSHSPVTPARARLPSFGQSYANSDAIPSFATSFQARHRRTGTVTSSPSDTISDIPITRVPTEENKRLPPPYFASNHNSPHRRSASNSGMGSIIFSDTDEFIDLSESILWSRGALINIKDVRAILPVSEELARVYTLSDADPVTVCGKNCEAATLHNRPDIAKLWGLVGLLLARSTPYYHDVKLPFKSKKQRATWLHAFQAALVAASLPSFDHVVIQKEGCVRIDPQHDAKGLELLIKEAKYRDWRCVDWGSHPFGQRLVESLFKYLERAGDVQTAAMLSCVLSQPVKNEKTERDVVSGFKAERSPSPTSSATTPVSPHSLSSPYSSAASSAHNTPTLFPSDYYPPLFMMNRAWEHQQPVLTPMLGFAPFLGHTYLKLSNSSSNISGTLGYNSDSQHQHISRRQAFYGHNNIVMSIRPKPSTITTNGFILTKFATDAVLSHGEEAHGERKRNGNAISVCHKKASLLDVSKKYAFHCTRLAYADMLYGWGLWQQRAELLKFTAPLSGVFVDRRYEDIDYGLQCGYCGAELPAWSSIPSRPRAPSYNPPTCVSCIKRSAPPTCQLCGLVSVAVNCVHTSGNQATVLQLSSMGLLAKPGKFFFLSSPFIPMQCPVSQQRKHSVGSLGLPIPHTSFGDGYVTMSEECLFDLLFDIPSFQKTVREVAGVGLKATKMATRAAFMKNPSKGRLLEEVFLLPPEMLVKSRYVLDDSPRRYVRTPSFKTNGLVLSLLWIDTTSKPPPPDRTVEDAINLPNIFKNKTLQSTHQDAWIIAIDPGATCIAGAVAFDPNHPDQRRNLAVTTKSLAEPERRYRDWLEGDKPEAICTAERECTKSDQETWPVFLERFVRSYDIARAYYSTKRYKRKRWDADKAKRGELDRVLEGIVKMVGESMGHKLSGGKQV
ncbi:hypothetical protein SeLEV6574_g02007, partial [Synchytrium endobioticum]